MSKNKTIYQELGSYLEGNKNKGNVYAGKRDSLKFNNIADKETKRLELQQDKYLSSTFQNVIDDRVMKSLNFETTRQASYIDFESMEYSPEISAALDIYMEEATTTDKGHVLAINSNSNRVKNILEDLFYNRLMIDVTLPMYVRNMCKYGDNFLLLNIDSKNGIKSAKQLPNYEIDRIEGDVLSHYINPNTKTDSTKFKWSERSVVFNNFQVAHFRLLGDDRKLPYGTSMLEKARRVFKLLLLAEDAMLVYRVTRAPEKRVIKVNVGNINEDDIPAYIQTIANGFKRGYVIDPMTGDPNTRYNQTGNDQDFFIPVRSDDAANPIETLPGASNLDAIADIEYLQNKLCTALRIPKTFLGFGDSVGDGKNLSLMDVRFARTINRIQQSIIQELNKIAVIHLYMLGFEDELNNFSIGMHNPSSASKMLKIEELQTMSNVFKNLVSDAGDGVNIMSRTQALKEIFNWSDTQITDDLLKIRLEKAMIAELQGTTNIIKYTGLFDTVDRIYGDIDAAKRGDAISDPEGGEGGEGGGSGGGFGGGFGDDLDFGDDMGGDGDMDMDMDMGDDMDMDMGDDMGDDGDIDMSDDIPEELKESYLINKRLVKAKSKRYQRLLKEKYKTNYTKLYLESLNKTKETVPLTTNTTLNSSNKVLTENINKIEKIK